MVFGDFMQADVGSAGRLGGRGRETLIERHARTKGMTPPSDLTEISVATT
jgi:hypothetical protein